MAEARGEPGTALAALAPGARVRLRRALLCAALAAPLAAIPPASRALADGLSQRGGLELAALAAHLDPPRPSQAEPAPAALLLAAGVTPELAEIEVEPAQADRRHRRQENGAAPAPTPITKGIYIRADAVLRAARSGARPSGSPVPASGSRPAGLALGGVGQFGVGLRDGDVLTSVAGAPATSVGAVVAAITGAWQAKARVLSAVVWRGGQQIQVAIELPRSG